MLISLTLYATVWIGCFDRFGETWNSMQLMHHEIIRDQLWFFTWER
jgi:hypothetical protein